MSTIRVQALPKFPASVEAGDGMIVTRSGGVFTFPVDVEAVLGAIGDPVEVAHGGTGNDYSASSGILSFATGTPSLLASNGTGNVIKSAGTLAIASGKTLTASNTLTFAGTDASSIAFGAGG